MSTGRPPSTGRAGDDDAAKRRAYLAVLLLAVPLLLVLMTVPAIAPAFRAAVFPALIVHNVVLALVIWRRRTASGLIEPFMLLPAVVVLYGYLAWLAVTRPPPTSAEGMAEVAQTMMWVGVIFPLCFLILGTRRGARAAWAAFAAFLVLAAPLMVRDGLLDGQPGALARAGLSTAVLFAATITLLRVLASRLERLAAARARADALAVQATADPLTGLANRRRLDDELAREVAQARRHGHPLAAALIDLDHFKQVNDRFGHQAGDDALVAATRRLGAVVRDGDLLGRWGGEEFLLLAPHADAAAAAELAERLRRSVAEAPFPGVGRLTVSVGAATLAAEDDERSLLRRVDLALYAAKREGRDRVVALSDAAALIDLEGADDLLGPRG